MSTRIFGIGFGLFILLLLWCIALIVLIVTRRANSSNTRSIGLLVLMGVSAVTCIILMIPRVAIDHSSEQMDQYSNFWHLQISRYVKADERKSVAAGAKSLSQSDEWSKERNDAHSTREPEVPVDGLHVVRWLLLSLSVVSLAAAAAVVFLLVVERTSQRPKLPEMMRSARRVSEQEAQVSSSSK